MCLERLTCGTHTSPLLLRISAGLSPSVGSNVSGSLSIPSILLSMEVATCRVAVSMKSAHDCLGCIEGANVDAIPAKEARITIENFIVDATAIVSCERDFDVMKYTWRARENYGWLKFSETYSGSTSDHSGDQTDRHAPSCVYRSRLEKLHPSFAKRACCGPV